MELYNGREKTKLDNEVMTQLATESQQAIDDIITSFDAFFTQEIRSLQNKRRALKKFSSKSLIDAWLRLNVESISRRETVKSFTELILAEIH